MLNCTGLTKTRKNYFILAKLTKTHFAEKRIFGLDHPQFIYSHKYRCNRLNIRTSQNHVRKFLFIIQPRRCTMYLYSVKNKIFHSGTYANHVLNVRNTHIIVRKSRIRCTQFTYSMYANNVQGSRHSIRPRGAVTGSDNCSGLGCRLKENADAVFFRSRIRNTAKEQTYYESA